MGFTGYYYYYNIGYCYYLSLLVLSTTFWENPLFSKSEAGGEVTPKKDGDWEAVEFYLVVTFSFYGRVLVGGEISSSSTSAFSPKLRTILLLLLSETSFSPT